MAQASWASDLAPKEKPVCPACNGTGRVNQTLGRSYLCGCQSAQQFAEAASKCETEQDFIEFLNSDIALF